MLRFTRNISSYNSEMARKQTKINFKIKSGILKLNPGGYNKIKIMRIYKKNLQCKFYVVI